MKSFMLSTVVLSALIQNGLAADAHKLHSSPGYPYSGSFCAKDTDYGVTGSISVYPSAHGPASVSVDLANLPSSGGPFLYHIHTDPVAVLPDGKLNCSATLSHLDPYERGESPVCDSTQPETCQVGDLSGKHGPATPDASGTWQDNFTDAYISTWDRGNKAHFRAFVGNARSVVVHFANKTRIACANLDRINGAMVPARDAAPAGSSDVATESCTSSAATSASQLPSSTGAGRQGAAVTQKITTVTATIPVASATQTGGAAALGASLRSQLGLGLGVAAVMALTS